MTEKMKKDKDYPRVLFRAINPVLFRTTSIGHLYEISQVYPTVLLTEKIDSETEKILYSKRLFPKLQKIIFTEEPFYDRALIKNNRLYRTIKKVVETYRPDIVVSTEDVYPGSLYLMRFAKKTGALTIAIQSGFQITDGKKLYLWSCLMNSYLKMPGFLPFSVRLFFVRLKKYLGYFFYYWILPLTVGEMPFPGKTSFVFWKISAGLRDADYSIVFSKRDYDLSVKDGVSPEKLFVIGHPLEHKSTKRFFEKSYFSQNREKENSRTLTIMLSCEKIGFKKGNYSLIPEEKMRKNKAKIIKLITEILTDWKIFIKPHPDIKNVSEARNFFGFVPDNVSIVEPSEPADKYIKMSDVIIGMPPPSTTLFTASLQCPEKILLSLDLNNEFLGDTYKNFNGIEYINSEKKFIDVLNLIRNNEYSKERGVDKNSTFPNINELLDYIYNHHLKTSPPLKLRRASKYDLC